MELICPICQGHKNIRVFDDALGLYKCRLCRHTFTYEKTDDTIYDETYYAQEHKNWFENPNYPLFHEVCEAALRLAPRPAASLLDIGCGKGDFLDYVHQHYPQVALTGTDVSPCSEKKGLRIIQGDFLGLKLHETFDVIVCLAVIEHIHAPDAFIKRIHQSLAPHGIVVITTVNSDGLLYTLARWLNAAKISAAYKRLYSKHHCQHFNNHSLRTLLEKHGFEIISQKNHDIPINSADFPSASIATQKLYKFTTLVIFFLSTIFKSGYLQTMVCKKI